MAKRFFVATLFIMLTQSLFGQDISIPADSITAYFNEIKVAAKEHQPLWTKDLYGPILLVNPITRQIFANAPDSAGALTLSNKIYTGILPKEVSFSNTSIRWNGIDWAMIILPLPKDKQDRINLLAHELFHVSQPALGFHLSNSNNNHLDQKDGRIYLRLELEALIKALQTTNGPERRTHLTNALTFRAYRHSLYPDAKDTENSLELNEGLAEYTGFLVSGRDNVQAIEHLILNIHMFLNNPTFVRSFAYQTIPVYGYLLDNIRKGWNKEITVKTNLTDYFISAFNISLPIDLKKASDSLLKQYSGDMIVSEEITREKKTKTLIAEYKNKFITLPHLDIAFEKMNITFDPRNIMPVEDKGTVYPNIRVTDNWGILTVTKGALMSPRWNKISVTPPVKIEKKSISGEGWTLDLNEGYSLVKDESTGIYKLIKK